MANPDAFTGTTPVPVFEKRKDEFLISTNPDLLDVAVIHQYLSQESYWAQGIPVSVVEKSLQHSLAFGLYHQNQQIGLARVVTDYAVFAYLCDVFVLPAFRGQGLSKWLMQTMLEHPDLQLLRSWMLGTKDAHGLYMQFGFTPAEPGRIMMRRKENPYQQKPLA